MKIRVEFVVSRSDVLKVIADTIITNGVNPEDIRKAKVLDEVRRRYWDSGYSWGEEWQERREYDPSDLEQAFNAAYLLIRKWGYKG